MTRDTHPGLTEMFEDYLYPPGLPFTSVIRSCSGSIIFYNRLS